MDIQYRKLNCVHNNTYACMCKSINIVDNRSCDTYKRANKLDKKQCQDVSKTMFEASPDIHPFRHNKYVDIVCDMDNCLYNKDGHCHSNGITVSNSRLNGMCITFVEK